MSQQDRDRECLRRVAAGEADALEELYDRHTPLLYPVALRILRDKGHAEDALQQAWLQAWRDAARYDPRRGPVVAWLLTLIRSRALDLYRSLSTRRRAEGVAEPERAVTPDPAAETARGQIGARVREALATLAPQQRQALEIAYFEGLSQSEIAQRLDTPLGTVKSWTRQGLLRLKDLLAAEERA